MVSLKFKTKHSHAPPHLNNDPTYSIHFFIFGSFIKKYLNRKKETENMDLITSSFGVFLYFWQKKQNITIHQTVTDMYWMCTFLKKNETGNRWITASSVLQLFAFLQTPALAKQLTVKATYFLSENLASCLCFFYCVYQTFCVTLTPMSHWLEWLCRTIWQC